jgi:hypothetical protein
VSVELVVGLWLWTVCLGWSVGSWYGKNKEKVKAEREASRRYAELCPDEVGGDGE